VRHHLRRKGKQVRSKRPKMRGKIETLHTVDERPKQADERSRLGEWADDTLVAAGPMCLLVLADRAFRLLLAEESQHDSKSVSKAEVGLLQGRPLETLTPDRGKQLAGHTGLTDAL
jgi:IS30 family transposase